MLSGFQRHVLRCLRQGAPALTRVHAQGFILQNYLTKAKPEYDAEISAMITEGLVQQAAVNGALYVRASSGHRFELDCGPAASQTQEWYYYPATPAIVDRILAEGIRSSGLYTHLHTRPNPAGVSIRVLPRERWVWNFGDDDWITLGSIWAGDLCLQAETQCLNGNNANTMIE